MMNKPLLTIPILALSAVAFGQTPSTTQSSGTASGQTLTGILMDASCQEISSHRSMNSTGLSAAVTPSSIDSAASGTSTPKATDPSMPRTTASAATDANRPADPSIATAGRTEVKEAGGAPTDVAAAGKTNTHVANSGKTTTEVAAAEKTTTDVAAAGKTSTDVATAGPNTAVESGRDTAASATTTTTAAATAGAPTEIGTGTRSRTMDTDTAGVPTTVREKYKNCQVNSNTSSFALHANGQVYMLDDTSNSMVRQQLSSDQSLKSAMADASGSPKWMSVSVNGTPNGNQMSVVSIHTR